MCCGSPQNLPGTAQRSQAPRSHPRVPEGAPGQGAGAEPAPQIGHPIPSLTPFSLFSPQRPRASLRPPPHPSSASLLGLDCACNPKGNQRKPTKEPPFPPSLHPLLWPAPGHEAAVAGPSPPDTWKLNSAAARMLPPPPPHPQSLFANQDTDSVFNFAMGRVG